MKRLTLISITLIFFAACKTPVHDLQADTARVNAVLDSLNATAARADFTAYFKLYSDESIFTGTDATERWDKKQFMAYAKPFFDKGKAWTFRSIDRHVSFDDTGNLAWFDELLNTQMKVCRGSGVLVRQGDDWKIKQYILSTTIPNEKMDSVTKMKSAIEDGIIGSYPVK